jgi:radical SAM superfamily enzyme YgiQ (UPF0313 family)
MERGCNIIKSRDTNLYKLKRHLYILSWPFPKLLKELLDSLILSIENTLVMEKIPSNLDILLISCPYSSVYYPPLGIAYLETYLRTKSIHAGCLDLNIILYKNFGHRRYIFFTDNQMKYFSEEHSVLNQFIEKWSRQIVKTKPKIVGFSVTNVNTNFSLKLAERIKELHSNIIIIFGGPNVMFKGNKLLKKRYVDYILKNESEYSLFRLINRLLKRVSKTANELGQDIDSLSYPKFESLNLSDYINLKKSYVHPVLWSRGCIGNCSFCTDKLQYPGYRFRNPKNIVEELKFFLMTYGIKSFDCFDRMLDGDILKLEQVCDLMIKNKLKICWGGNISGGSISFQLLCKMGKAGCRYITIGLESASSRIRKDMLKMPTVKDIEDVIKYCKSLGIKVFINIIVGYPLEKEYDFCQTLQFIEKNKDFITGVSASTCDIHPMTKLYDKLESLNISYKSPSNWWMKDNSIQTRLNRLFRLKKLLRKKKIKLYYCDIVKL